jgi:hypothetical protein
MNRKAHTPKRTTNTKEGPKDQTNNKPNKPICKTAEPFKNTLNQILAKLQLTLFKLDEEETNQNNPRTKTNSNPQRQPNPKNKYIRIQ